MNIKIDELLFTFAYSVTCGDCERRRLCILAADEWQCRSCLHRNRWYWQTGADTDRWRVAVLTAFDQAAAVEWIPTPDDEPGDVEAAMPNVPVGPGARLLARWAAGSGA